MLAGLVPSRPLSWHIDGHVLLTSLQGLPSICVCVPSSSYKDTRNLGLGSILVTSFYLTLLFKDPAPQFIRRLRGWGRTAHLMNSGRGTQFTSQETQTASALGELWARGKGTRED